MDKEKESVDECVEEIKAKKGRDVDDDVGVSCVFALVHVNANARQYSACVDGSGARYWKLFCSLVEVIAEIKAPSPLPLQWLVHGG